jgi:hypothetical protein
MKSIDILKKGTVLEEYEYINGDDLDNQYYANIVLYDDKLYEIIFDSNHKILFPDEEPRLISENANEVLNTPYNFDEPVPVTFNFSDDVDTSLPTTKDFGSYFNSHF